VPIASLVRGVLETGHSAGRGTYSSSVPPTRRVFANRGHPPAGLQPPSAAEDLGCIGDAVDGVLNCKRLGGAGRRLDAGSNGPEGTLIRVFDQQCRTPRPAPKGETRCREVESGLAESQKWAAVATVRRSATARHAMDLIGDREADCYETSRAISSTEWTL